MHLPIPLGLHKILDFLSAFEVVIGFPMHEAFLSSVSKIVQNKLVHVSIPEEEKRGTRNRFLPIKTVLGTCTMYIAMRLCLALHFGRSELPSVGYYLNITRVNLKLKLDFRLGPAADAAVYTVFFFSTQWRRIGRF